MDGHCSKLSQNEINVVTKPIASIPYSKWDLLVTFRFTQKRNALYSISLLRIINCIYSLITLRTLAQRALFSFNI